MEVFETKPKIWGNSLGVTIPNEIVKKEHLSPQKKVKVFVLNTETEHLKEIFGTLKLKRPTQEVMQEIDRSYD